MAILLREDRAGIAHLTMNTPDNLNALSDAMLAAIRAEFTLLMDDTTTRVVILSGAGKAFCAGHDLKEIINGRRHEDGGAAYFSDLFERCGDIMQMINRCHSPSSRRCTASPRLQVASWWPLVIWPLPPKVRALVSTA